MSGRAPRPAHAAFLHALAWAALIGCDGEPQAPAAPVVVEIWVFTPVQYDQAIVVRFDRAVEGFVPAPGFRGFPDIGRPSASLLVVAAAPMPAGESRIGTLRLPDGRDPGGIRARVVEAARSDHALRDQTADYRVRLAW